MSTKSPAINTNKVSKSDLKAQNVITVIDFTKSSPAIILECPVCNSNPDRIGAKFCSECGTKLSWDNIIVREPVEPTKSVAEPPLDPTDAPTN